MVLKAEVISKKSQRMLTINFLPLLQALMQNRWKGAFEAIRTQESGAQVGPNLSELVSRSRGSEPPDQPPRCPAPSA